jgi:gas vesicle protein
MAKTIDDLIVEISDLVKTLHEQNSNSGGKSGHNSFDFTGDVFQSFAGEIRSLAETAKQLSEAQSNFSTEIAKKGTQEWQDYREGIRNNIKSSAAAMEEFKNTLTEFKSLLD